MATTTTPNMSLTVPGVGTEVGPNWANEINADLGVLDQHNHTLGQGVQIPVSGLSIQQDFPLNGYNLTEVNTVRFEQLTSTIPATTPNVAIIYSALVSGNYELFYNDTAGNPPVQITKTGGVNATSSGITGPGGASASFSSGVLVVDGAVNTPGNIQAGSVFFGNNTAGSNFAEVSPPSSLASSYSMVLPPANGSGGTAFLTYDTSNNIGVGPALSGGINTSNIANQAVTGAKIANNTITEANIAPRANASTGNFSNSSSSGSAVIIGTLTQTFVGNPCYIGLSPGTDHSIIEVSSGSTNALAQYFITIDGGTSYGWDFNNGGNNVYGAFFSLPAPLFLSSGLTPGSHTITLSVQALTAGTTISISNVIFYVYELI